MVNALKLLKISLFIGLLKILREKNKTYDDDDDDDVLEEEFMKYIVLNTKKMIKND